MYFLGVNMAKKTQEPKVIEVKTVTLENGQQVLVKVYEAVKEQSKHYCKFRHAKQVSDFALVGNWKRNSTASE